jgi:hypothetical protein
MRALALIAVILTACSSESGSGSSSGTTDGGSEPGTCPQDLPSACPSPPPSFKSQVDDVFQRKCGACHTGTGVEAASYNFATYSSIAALRSPILNQVYACRMPPADAPKLTAEERALLLGWLVCKAPDN